ncbi:hypothetical protein RCC89_07315 [Cytophagaceae bacterium ABcell3]|nr:hypothetical protein RCC89_07315 [Cytophagaceae bacterium ABcell3]
MKLNNAFMLIMMLLVILSGHQLPAQTKKELKEILSFLEGMRNIPAGVRHDDNYHKLSDYRQ